MYLQYVWQIFFILTSARDAKTNSLHMDSKTDECKNGCLSKCCPENQLVLDNVNETICVENTLNLTLKKYTEVEIYNKDIIQNVKRINKTLQDFTIVYNEIFNDLYHIVVDSEDIYMKPNKKLYILENGLLAVWRLNHLRQWEYIYRKDSFCIDLQTNGCAGQPDPRSLKLAIRFLIKLGHQDLSSRKKTKIIAYAMLISYFFLILVLLTYILLPEKRNLPSLMMMAYVTSLATAYLFRAIQILKGGQLTKKECVFVGLSLYFSILASFTWMNVMSYDLWTRMSKPRAIRRQPHWKTVTKFCRYSIYGYGLPLLVTIFVVVIDYVDLTSVPSFVKPHFVAEMSSCFFQIEEERQLYMNGPILVATVINSAFFVITGLHMWRNSAAPGGTGDSRNTKKDKNRFIIYLRLAHVMGINWILEVAGLLLSPNSWVVVLSDVFNSSAGLFIFIIFICKKDVIILLCKRFSVETALNRRCESSAEHKVTVPKEHQTPIPLS